MTNLRVGYLARNTGSVSDVELKSARDLMTSTGGNTGNLAFFRGTREMFDDEIVLIQHGADANDYRDQIDKLVIPAANFLNPDWDFGTSAQLIEGLGKECLVFGLGAQAQSENQVLTLRDGTVRFLQAAAAHAKTIFVRGQFTVEVCRRYGVRNTEPLGCPSITLNGDPSLGVSTSDRIGRPLERLYCAGASLKSENEELERGLFDMIKLLPGSTYCVQAPAELLDLADGTAQSEGTAPKVIGTLQKFLSPQTTVDAFKRDFLIAARYFSDVTCWTNHTAGHSYSVCTRIHGGIISLMGGVPTLAAGHDARIRELCEAMLIPCRPPGEIARKLSSLPEYFSSLGYDGAKFDERRAEIARTYYHHIEQCGMTPSLKLARLAGCIDSKRPTKDR